MSKSPRPIIYTVSIGFFVLSVLFIGHLVKVEAVPTPPSGLEPGNIALIAPNWRASRDQYDPTYMDRIQSLDRPAESSSPVGTDWDAVRAQYDPTYMDRIQSLDRPAEASSPVGIDWDAVRAQYNPGYALELSRKPVKKGSSGCRGH